MRRLGGSSLRVLLCVGVSLAIALMVSAGAARPAAASNACSGSTVYFVAHPDDSILFMDPDLQQDIDANRCVETVFVTSGDAGQSDTYWSGREQGAEAAYAELAGVSDSWTTGDAGIAGHPMTRVTLDGAPNVSLVFMRLPDGGTDGSGFASTGFTSLQQLWSGDLSAISPIDGSPSYTESGLVDTLTAADGVGRCRPRRHPGLRRLVRRRRPQRPSLGRLPRRGRGTERPDSSYPRRLPRLHDHESSAQPDRRPVGCQAGCVPRVCAVRRQCVSDRPGLRAERVRGLVVARVRGGIDRAADDDAVGECGAVGDGVGVDGECVDGSVGGEGC